MRRAGWGSAFFLLAAPLWLHVGCYTGVDGGRHDGGDATAGPSSGGTDPSGGESGDAGSDTAGDDDDDAPPVDEALPPNGWHRLTRAAYHNTVHDLLVYSSDPATGDAAFDALSDVLSLLPHDSELSYATHDDVMSQVHVDAYFEVGMRVGEEITRSPQRLAAFVGPCDDETCVDDFVYRFGRLVHRRPLTDSEFAFYRHDAYQAGDALEPDALADAIGVMLSSPSFVYRIELGDDAFDPADDFMVLSDHEVASRIAYLLWDSMPDPALLDAADAGQLGTQAQRRAQVDRLFADPRSEGALSGFFVRWLDLGEPPNLAGAAADPAFAAMAGDALPSATLADDMAAEVLDSIAYHTWVADDDAATWFASPYVFARTDELASIYGVGVWDGTSEPPLAPPDRAGLLTRAGLLAEASMRSRPILRGARIRKRLLCDPLPPPPDDAAGTAGVPGPTDGARAWAEEVTGVAPCNACHTQLNPLGFALEGWDPLGRSRSVEQLFDDDGQLVAEVPVDARADINLGGMQAAVDGAADLAALVRGSGMVEGCIAREYASYGQGRDPDAAVVSDLTQMLQDGAAMGEFFGALALHPAFAVRGWEEG